MPVFSRGSKPEPSTSSQTGPRSSGGPRGVLGAERLPGGGGQFVGTALDLGAQGAARVGRGAVRLQQAAHGESFAGRRPLVLAPARGSLKTPAGAAPIAAKDTSASTGVEAAVRRAAR